MNKYLIDASSLLSLVSYYLPFDKDRVAYDFIESKFNNGEFILIESIKNECKRTRKGAVLQELCFLNQKIKSLPNLPVEKPKIHNKIDNNWYVPSQKKAISPEEYESQKTHFINSGDCQLILHVIQDKENNPIVVTEESSSPNDNKLFKKIPVICQQENIKCQNIALTLKQYIDLQFSIK